jgi:uncharacterized membrane protein (UPF0127 family)
MQRLFAALLITLVLVGCGGDEPAESAATEPDTSTTTTTVVGETPSPSPTSTVTFEPAKVLIDTGDDSVLIDAEKAETPEQHSLGLMNRTSLPEDSGMVFLFFEEHTGGFWMKNTLIPLSIAFFDEKGKILRILDMEPCTEDPCAIYDPGTSYYGALEVNQGAFDTWNVSEGDRITVTH